MPSISEFKGAIRSGLQRTNRFKVLVNFPEFAATTDTIRQSSLLARTATLPTSTLGVIEVLYAGRAVPVPGDRQFEEWAVTFIGTQDWAVRNAFEAWQQGINGNESNSGLSNLEDYQRDIEFSLLDNNDNVVATYILRDAWPLSVSGGDVDSGSQDAFMEFNVSLRYLNWEKKGVTR